MIRLACARDVWRLLSRVLAFPEDYEQILVCSPFIDERVGGMLAELGSAARRKQCGFRVVTTPMGRRRLADLFPGHRGLWETNVVGVHGLHAKVYLAIGRQSSFTRAIVTSANLTQAGLIENLEAGVVARTSSDAGRQLVSEIRGFLERLIDVPPRPYPIFNPRRAA